MKIILMYTLKVSYTVEQDYIHICFKSIPYNRAKIYLYILEKSFIQFGKIILIYVLKLFYIVRQDHTHICFKFVLYGKINNILIYVLKVFYMV